MSDTFSGGDISAAMTAASTSAASTTPSASPAAEPSGQQATTGTAPTQPAAAEGTSATTSSTDSSATAAPVAQDAMTSQTAPDAGEPPKERWKDILDNARKKVREEEFGWAQGVDRGEFEATKGWMALANRDPLAAVDRMVQTIARDPNGAAALRSYFGRLLGRRPAAQQNAQQHRGGDDRPGPDIPTSESNGQPVVYSAQRMQELLAWQQRQFEGMVSEKLMPFEQERQTRAEAEEQRQREIAADRYAQTTMNSVAAQPGFKEHSAEIARVYQAIPLDDPRSEGEKLRDAYLQVIATKRDTVVRQQTVRDLRDKTAANTVPANSNAPAAPFDHKKASWAESFRHEWEKKQRESAAR